MDHLDPPTLRCTNVSPTTKKQMVPNGRRGLAPETSKCDRQGHLPPHSPHTECSGRQTRTVSPSHPACHLGPDAGPSHALPLPMFEQIPNLAYPASLPPWGCSGSCHTWTLHPPAPQATFPRSTKKQLWGLGESSPRTPTHRHSSALPHRATAPCHPFMPTQRYG